MEIMSSCRGKRMNELIKFIGSICKECHGQCCTDFPVWAMKKDGTLHRNRCKNVGTNKLAMNSYWANYQIEMNWTEDKKSNYNRPCYFWLMGGCPPDKHAKACKQWICPLIEDIVYLPRR